MCECGTCGGGGKGRILDAVKKGRVLVSDGAWGTFLQNKGLQPGECPELWCLSRPNDVMDVAKAYIDAGADMIFPEAMQNEKEFEAVRKAINVPMLANMTEFGKSRLLNKKELENLGFNLVIYPVTTLRLAMGAVDRGLDRILNPPPARPYRTEPRPMGLRQGFSYDNVAELLSPAEGEDHS